MNNTLTYIDLFAGMGGMRQGLVMTCNKYKIEQKCMLTSEIKPHALQVYNKAFNENNLKQDITKINENTFSNVDFILAGFPCQPFSYAGKGLGFVDTRGTMFFETYRFIKKLKPKGFLLENVEGLVTHDKGKTFKTIIRLLKELNYKISYKIINAKDFGLAQERKRIYICGSLYNYPNLNYSSKEEVNFIQIRDFNKEIINSTFTKKLCNYCPIEELQGKNIRDKRAGNNNIHSWDLNLKGETTKIEKDILNFILKERRKKSLAIKYNIEWKDGMPVPFEHISDYFSTLTSENLNNYLENLVNMKYIKIEEKYGIFGYNISTGMLSFPITRIQDDHKQTPTIVATDVSRIGIVEKNGIRQFTTNELLKLFGYPPNWPLDIIPKELQFDLIGNTVCIPIIQFCCERIIDTFS